MVTLKALVYTLAITITFTQCSPDANKAAHYPQKAYTGTNIVFDSLPLRQKVYIPVYSDIYHMSGDQRFLLTITASVRNTSLVDTLYVQNVNYYASDGRLIRQYLRNNILLRPLESADFVVEYLESEGGAGASFIVDWGATTSTLKPVIHGIMIGSLSQQGISFLTEGVIIQTITDSLAH